MRLKRNLSLGFLVSLFLLSCTDEPELINIKTTIRNDSGMSVSIRGFNVPNEIVLNENLNDGQSTSCEASSEVFLGLNCGVDSLVVEFGNGNGYICADRPNANTICFDNSPLIGIESHFNKVEENSYEFIITKEDFINAFELPE